MPKKSFYSVRSKTFTVDGTWTPPNYREPGSPSFAQSSVTVLAISTSTGASFGGTGSVASHLERIFTASANTTYNVVVGAGTVTLYWLGVRGA